MERILLVSYSEISSKGKRTKKELEENLLENIKYLLMRLGIYAKFQFYQDRLIIRNCDIKAFKELSRVFGISTLSSGIETTPELNKLVEDIVDIAGKTLDEGDTFAIRARRRRMTGKTYSSKDVEKLAGAEILRKYSDRKLKVELENPVKTIYVEIYEDKAFVLDKLVKGPGGLPLGFSGKCLMLFSGGMGSVSAFWLLMRRGVLSIPVYFNLSPFRHENHLNNALEVIKSLREYVTIPNFKLYLVPYGSEFIENIQQYVADKICIFCKRNMLKFSQLLAEKLSINALATGDKIGQKRFQTIENLCAKEANLNLPVLKPILSLSRGEVEKICADMGVHDLVLRRRPICKFARRRKTEIALSDVLEIEKSLGVNNILEKMLKKVEEVIL